MHPLEVVNFTQNSSGFFSCRRLKISSPTPVRNNFQTTSFVVEQHDDLLAESKEYCQSWYSALEFYSLTTNYLCQIRYTVKTPWQLSFQDLGEYLNFDYMYTNNPQDHSTMTDQVELVCKNIRFLFKWLKTCWAYTPNYKILASYYEEELTLNR